MTITKLSALSSDRPTDIDASTEIDIPGCHIEWDGGPVGSSLKSGARWTLRNNKTLARVRDLVIR